jgi:carboxymethylenebutenolidase
MARFHSLTSTQEARKNSAVPMNTAAPPRYTRKEIGSASVRFPTGTGMPDPLDVAVDPYAPTKKTQGTYVKGFQAWPQRDEPFPAVVILHDWWGLNKQIHEIAFRLAEHGYAALAVDQYSRLGRPVTAEPDQAAQLMARVNAGLLTQDLTAAVEYLNFQEYVKKHRIAVLGFGMGGSHALSFACARRQLRVAVAFYGNPPLASLATLRCPVLYHQPENDEVVPPHDVEQLCQRLTAAKVICEVARYPGASHGFFDETRPDGYQADAAASAWNRTLAFLDQFILAEHAGVRPLPDSQRQF